MVKDMKTITIKENGGMFTIEIGNCKYPGSIVLTKEDLEVLKDECNKYVENPTPSYQETFEVAQKQADEIYKKYLESFFQRKHSEKIKV